MTIFHVKKFLHMAKKSPQAPPVMPVTNIGYGLCIAPKLKVSNGWVLRTPNRI